MAPELFSALRDDLELLAAQAQADSLRSVAFGRVRATLGDPEEHPVPDRFIPWFDKPNEPTAGEVWEALDRIIDAIRRDAVHLTVANIPFQDAALTIAQEITDLPGIRRIAHAAALDLLQDILDAERNGWCSLSQERV
jgi:hypothetical protein